MAVDIESFKRDLDLLKNQRSVIQAKLDEANRHVTELMETLKVMGFDSIDAAKQAYAKQMAEAESQHALVKKLIGEIADVDAKIPTRESVMEKLDSLSSGIIETHSVPEVQLQTVPPVQTVQPAPVQPAPVQPTGMPDLSDMLFASL